MKINRTIFLQSVLILLFISFFASCKKEDTANNYSYFVSKQFAVEYNTGYITSLIDLAAVSLPDIAGIKAFMNNDISVYKVTYKTKVNGSQINASGLVCVPKSPGKYPVLSFQNGTNTVNASSPSQSPLDYTYQLVEFIASMGYVVVISDYPGFGVSSDIAHPYLVKEPTVQSLVDLLYSVKEMAGSELPGITLKNEYYLLGYSQGGWATLALDKALEQNYSSDFTLGGVACGAGPYDITFLLQGMVNKSTYPMPYYLAYIVNAYITYNQFTNPASDIFNEPYASRVSTLFTGLLPSDQINSQLTTSIPGLINADFISGFATNAKYASIRTALNNNSVSAWNTYKPLLLLHGGNDTFVDPASTENMYSAMIQAGTSPEILEKHIVPGVGHTEGALPCMIQGILFLNSLHSNK
jgi:pimeloyl-ACP methyl ester carboxylesterase